MIRAIAALDRAGQWLDIPLVLGPVGSDNRRYAAVGFPAVGVNSGGEASHSPADTPDRVDLDAVALCGRLLLATLWQIGFRDGAMRSFPGGSGRDLLQVSDGV